MPMNRSMQILRPWQGELHYAVAHDLDDDDYYICARVKLMPPYAHRIHNVHLYAQIYATPAEVPDSFKDAPMRVRAVPDFKAGEGVWLFPRVPGAHTKPHEIKNNNVLAVWLVIGEHHEFSPLPQLFSGKDMACTECSPKGLPAAKAKPEDKGW